MDFFLAFITGLTTGGLSCLAVQGGLLASSLAHQIEKDLQDPIQPKSKKIIRRPSKSRHQLALPILVFLLAKLAAYSVLGFILGLVGQMVQLSPYTRAILQIGIGIFMLGSGLRMLNVHPIFRYFAFEPPAFLRRKLRKTAAGRSDTTLTTPALLGLFTVLIPCGVTQAVMAAALGTGNPLQGAVILFAFTLGTSPLFFGLAYFAVRLGEKLERYFMRFAAIIVLALALLAIDSGLTLAGSPVSINRWVSDVFPSGSQVSAPLGQQQLQVFSQPGTQPRNSLAGNSPTSFEGSTITIQVRNTAYSPNNIRAKAGVPIRLKLVSDKVYSCSLAFVIPSLGIEQLLQPTGEAYINIPAQEKGTRMPFSCSMGMFSGIIIFDL